MRVIILVLQALVVFGKSSTRRQHVASSSEVHKLVKRAANLNLGFDLEAFRQDQLSLHNHYRQLHGVPLMVLDTTLTNQAQSYAEYLAANNLFQHCRARSCNPNHAGENLATAFGHAGVEINATYIWYREVFDYNYCSFPQGRATARPGLEGKQVGHFTQVVWYTSLKLGIGYARSPDRTKVYVVARYLAAGNFLGQYAENVPKANYLLDIFQNNCNGVSGGFTAWSAPSVCSKPCGKGVKFQTRTCTNPKPSFNGRDCEGEIKRLHPYWCNSQACVTAPLNERHEQCRQRGYTALSYNFGGKSECILYCLTGQSNMYQSRGEVDDGTKCQSGRGACLAGTCVLLGDEPATSAPPTSAATTTTVPLTATSAPATNTSAPATFSTAPSTNVPTTTAPPPTTTTAPPVTTTAPPTTTTAPPTTTTAPPTTTTAPPTTTTAPPTTKRITIPPTTFPLIPNGGYSEWSSPGPCSKSCGGGVSFRVRHCITPSPVTGRCIGPNREVFKQWCNPQPCDPAVDERNEQCENRGHEPDAHNFGGVDECYLYCKHSSTGYYAWRGAVDVGTRCNRSSGACVDNVCVRMTYQPGTIIEGEYKRYPTPSYWKNIVLAIPNGARNVQIIHNNHEVIAVVGYRSNYYYGYSGSSIVQGVKVTYHSNQDITIRGPVYPIGDNQLVVFAIGNTQADITYRYTPPSSFY